jgi:hypothetical protein
MAFTSITVNVDHSFSTSGDPKATQRATVLFVGPASYPTGGEPFVARDAGFDSIDAIVFEEYDDGTNRNQLRLDRGNDTIIIDSDTDGTEVVNATDLSARTYRARVSGVPVITSTAT